jgi:DHA1 family inner membrane transport protein
LFCVFTYIAPILEQITHVPPSSVSKVLVVFGVGITVGNLVGGRLADWKQMAVLIVGIMLLIVILLVMPFLELSLTPAVIMIFVWGAVHFATGSPLQARIVEQAKGAPNLASTLNQGAFNLGNALGASLGGIMLTQGISYRYLPWGSAAVAGVALAVALIALRVEQIEKRNQMVPV